MTVFVLGGGPAGMALVHGLALANGDDFVLLERDAMLGGLARTLDWGEHGAHDLGPHKIFTKDPQLLERVTALLPAQDWLLREKISQIYLHGHFLPYPPSPISLARVFGLRVFARLVASYGLARLRALGRRPAPRTFEEDISGRLGQGLYEVLFKPISLKLWGDPQYLDVKLSRNRIQTPSLLEVLSRMLGRKTNSESEALDFQYPRGGLQRLWTAIHEQASGHGRFLTGCEVRRLTVEQGRIVRLTYVDPAGDERVLSVGPQDFVVSTLPLGILTKLMGDVMPDTLRERIRAVTALNDLMLVFFKLDVPQFMPVSWVFVPDPRIVFHRVSEQESFDGGMTPGGTIVCCEIMSHDQRPLAKRSDAELAESAEAGLRQMGYTGFNVRDYRVIRLPRSYPVFRPGYQEQLQSVLAELDSVGNFRTVGRQGAFNYIGTLDAMDIGYGMARWLERRDPNSWQQERERTSNYPVLD